VKLAFREKNSPGKAGKEISEKSEPLLECG